MLEAPTWNPRASARESASAVAERGVYSFVDRMANSPKSPCPHFAATDNFRTGRGRSPRRGIPGIPHRAGGPIPRADASGPLPRWPALTVVPPAVNAAMGTSRPLPLRAVPPLPGAAGAVGRRTAAAVGDARSEESPRAGASGSGRVTFLTRRSRRYDSGASHVRRAK
ncbi:hypothetical protein NL676_025971 [Syzygium grande]|nr:hypothetical protein NL676_025971 [Syzygium grande]